MRPGFGPEGLRRGYSLVSSANTSGIDGESSGMLSPRSRRSTDKWGNPVTEATAAGKDRTQYEELLPRRSYVGDLDTLKEQHEEVIKDAIVEEK